VILIHGFNHSALQTREAYFQFKEQLGYFGYDYIIGFVWPCHEGRIYYPCARGKTPQLGKELARTLQANFHSAEQIDVLGHSMGCRIICEALKIVRFKNVFFLAPAIDADSFERDGSYNCIFKSCSQIIVYFSHHDTLLKWAYPLAEMSLKTALGLYGPSKRDNLPSNLTVVDATHLIAEHNAYKETSQLFHSLLKVLQESGKHLKITVGGEITHYEEEAFSLFGRIQPLQVSIIWNKIYSLVSYFFTFRHA